MNSSSETAETGLPRSHADQRAPASEKNPEQQRRADKHHQHRDAHQQPVQLRAFGHVPFRMIDRDVVVEVNRAEKPLCAFCGDRR